MTAALRAALEAHLPADEAEARHREAMLALLDGKGDSFSRWRFEPGHFTGSAFVVCGSTGLVLLHHHRRLGRWLQMGGHDDGEGDPARTALREAREESGLPDLALVSESPLDLDVHEIPRAVASRTTATSTSGMRPSREQPDAIRRDDAESLELAWLTLDEALERMGEPGAARALARLARILERLRGQPERLLSSPSSSRPTPARRRRRTSRR